MMPKFYQKKKRRKKEKEKVLGKVTEGKVLTSNV
jgi:hypothetical protein